MALVPAFIVHLVVPVLVDVFIDVFLAFIVHGFENFRRNSIESTINMTTFKLDPKIDIR